jgi:hypothetical protein
MRDIISYLNLPRINDLNELSFFLTYTKDQLNSFMFDKKSQYVSFKIPKKNSSEKRIINAPKKRLKMAQKIILTEILEKIPCSNESTAFKKNENGILKNALIHSPNIFLLKMDFNNFFQCIKIGCIKELFMQIGYNEKVSLNLASLCTFANQLPQGGICSPYLANLACYNFDKQVSEYCNSKNIAYTRYADDLLFSSNDLELLEQLKIDIVDIVKNNYNENFQISINNKKTRLIKKNAHKKVTGITINDQNIKASKKLKNKIRQEIYFIIKNKKDYNNKLIGQIAYVLSIEANEYAFKIRNYVNNVSEKYNYKENNIIKIINKMTKKYYT